MNLFPNVSLVAVIAAAIILAAGSATAQTARAAAPVADGTIVERKAYSFPAYDVAVKTTGVGNYADKAAYDAAVNDAQFTFQKVKYASDGLNVVAYLYAPIHTAVKKYPVIVYNRGSAIRGDIAPELIVVFHRLARQGFVVVAPLYRQSDGGDGKDELGGADMNDLMNIVPLAKSLEFADTNNLFLYGESRGGMMVYQAVRKRFPANAAAVIGAFTDMQEMIDSHPRLYTSALLRQTWPDFDAKKEEIYKTRSAIHWAEQLNMPLLIMHGGADSSVNPNHSLSLALRLQQLGKTYELIVYAHDGHILSRSQQDRDARAVAWFNKHRK